MEFSCPVRLEREKITYLGVRTIRVSDIEYGKRVVLRLSLHATEHYTFVSFHMPTVLAYLGDDLVCSANSGESKLPDY